MSENLRTLFALCERTRKACANTLGYGCTCVNCTAWRNLPEEPDGGVFTYTREYGTDTERRRTLEITEREYHALLNVYAAAARMRTFPVPFQEHWDLVGAVDECRNVMHPSVEGDS